MYNLYMDKWKSINWGLYKENHIKKEKNIK